MKKLFSFFRDHRTGNNLINRPPSTNTAWVQSPRMSSKRGGVSISFFFCCVLCLLMINIDMFLFVSLLHIFLGHKHESKKRRTNERTNLNEIMFFVCLIRSGTSLKAFICVMRRKLSIISPSSLSLARSNLYRNH